MAQRSGDGSSHVRYDVHQEFHVPTTAPESWDFPVWWVDSRAAVGTKHPSGFAFTSALRLLDGDNEA